MATTKTRRDLIDAVLDSLGVLVPGQAPSAEVVERVDDILDPSLALLEARGIAYIADAGTSGPPAGGEIANASFLPLADCVAWNIAGAFNLASDPSLKVKNDIAEELLRTIGRPARTRRLLTTDTQLRAGVRHTVRFNFTTGV